MMIQTALMNERGERLDLYSPGVHINAHTDNLGYQMSNQYVFIRSGFYRRVQSAYEQNQVGCELWFSKNQDEAVRKVMDFVAQSDELIFCYKGEVSERRMDVDAVGFSREGSRGPAQTKLTLTSKTPWYEPLPVIVLFGQNDGINAKTYTYTYPYRYRAQKEADKIDVTAGGHFDAEFTFRSTGPLENFMLEARVGEEVIGRLTLDNLQVGRGEELYYSTRVADSGVYKILADGSVIDVIEYIDLSNKNFFTLPPGKKVVMSIDSTGDTPDVAYLQFYQYYRTV